MFELGAVCLLGAFFFLSAPTAHAQRQMEALGRGVVAVRSNSTTAYVGWRMLGTDPDDIAFNLYRSANGGAPVQLTTNRTQTTDFLDTTADLTKTNSYFVRPVINGVEQTASATYVLPANASIQQFISVPLQIPPGGSNPDGSYTYSANDCSVGDLDGDGEYEIVLKWDPSNSHDNSQGGFTGPVYIDAYKLDGTRLWRINLGLNIRAGAHYTQFMVYDLDGDGKAELACKTAPGTIDGQGNNVIMPGDDPSIVYTNSSGYILSGPEYLTIFNGLTGAALATTNYVPPRGNVSDWGDSYGNRVDRFLACVAYLDGKRPSLVMCRGYYTRAVLAAWDWRNGQLTQRWVFDSDAGPTNNLAYRGQGNHNLSVGDVDGDGKDEVVYGSCVIDDNGLGLYSTGAGHGDAMHFSDLDPTRARLEVFKSNGDVARPNGLQLRDAGNGTQIWGYASTGADGAQRACALDIDPRYRGYEMWGGGDPNVDGKLFNAAGEQIGPSTGLPINFGVWWDADLLREPEDGTTISKWDWMAGNNTTLFTAAGAASNNGSKSNPGISGDMLGDWREEVVWRASDNSALRVYVSTIPATNRFYSLMHDPQYRLAIAWQNVGYNQPPHPGFYLGDGMAPPPVPPTSDANLVWRGGDASNAWDVTTTTNWFIYGVWTTTTAAVFSQGNSVLFDLAGSNNVPVNLVGTLTPGAVTVHSPKDYVFRGSGSLAGTTTVIKAGTGALTINTTNTYSGATAVSDGTLWVNGRLDQSPVTVRGSLWGLGRIGGIGRLGQGLTMQAGASLIPGNGTNVPGTLSISNSLTEAGGVVNYFDLSDDPSGTTKTNDLVNIDGDLNLSGINSIQLNLLNGTLPHNTAYPLFQYSGVLSGGISNLSVSLTAPSFTVALSNAPGQIVLVVISNRPPANIVWAGDGAANNWDTGLTTDWLNGASPDRFFPLDNVTFNNSGSTNPSVNLVGVLAPGSIVVTAAVDYTFGGSGSLTNPATLTKSGSGKLTLATVNGFTNKTIILGGALQLGDVTANNGSVGGSISNNASLIFANPNLLTIPGDISGVGSITKNGDGTLVLAGTNTYSGTTTILDGTLQVGNGGTSGTWGTSNVVNNSILVFNRSNTITNSSVISGTGSLTQLGAGVLILSNNNTYSGGTTVSAGSLRLAHNNAAGTGSITALGSVQVGNGVTVANTLNCSGTADNILDCPSGTGTWMGNVVFATGGSQFRPGTTGGTLILSNGAVALNNRFFFTPRGTVTFAGNFSLSTAITAVGFGRSDGGSVNVTIRGNATLSLGDCVMGNGKDMNPLTLTIRDAGRLTLTGASGANTFDFLNVSSGPASSTINLAGGTLTVNSFVKTSVGSGLNSTLNFTGGVVKAIGSTTGFLNALPGLTARVRPGGARIDDAGFAITINQPLFGSTGDSGLTKLGIGTLTLTGTNSYNGGTIVSNGTLLVNNTTASGTGTGAVLVVAAATLGGTGIIRGPVIVNGTLAPGSGGVGTLTVTNLVLNSGAVMQYDLGTTSDKTVVSSNLTLSGTLNINNVSGFGIGTYTLFTYGKTLTYNGVTIGSAPSSFSYSIDTGTAGQINLVVGPPLTAFQQWQLQYFNCTNCTQADGNVDADGDGMSNTNEFLAGTNPTNSVSALRIISVAPQGNDMSIAWTTAGGRTNALQASASLENTNFIDITSPIAIAGSGDVTTNHTHTGGATNVPTYFYRVRVVP